MPIDIQQIELFVLVFIRATSALAVMPVFRHAAFPGLAKAGFGAALSLLLIPALSPSLPPLSGTVLDYLLIAGKESLCGILLGFAGQMLFFAVEICGQMVGFQAGFSMVASIDPNTDSQSNVLTQFYSLAAMLIFLTLDGHHLMLTALVDSLRTIPVGGLRVGSGLAEWSVYSAARLTGDGIRLAAPLMVSLLLTDLGLGILSRIAPAMNVFAIGFSLKVALTLLMASASIGIVAHAFTAQYDDFSRHLPDFLKLLNQP